MHDVGMSLLLLAGLALLPRYCDIWGHDKKEFEKRRRVYASGWQKWMMTKRNLGRYGSLAVLYAIWICGSPVSGLTNRPALPMHWQRQPLCRSWLSRYCLTPSIANVRFPPKADVRLRSIADVRRPPPLLLRS